LSNPNKGTINWKTFEKNVALAVYETAQLDLKAGRYSRAEKGTKRYLKTYPKSSRAHFLLGEVYRQRAAEGDDKQAIKQYKKTLKLKPSTSKAYMSMGIVHMKAGDKKAARKAFKSYLHKDAGSEETGFVKSYLEQLK
jgi:TolA-binding protein